MGVRDGESSLARNAPCGRVTSPTPALGSVQCADYNNETMKSHKFIYLFVLSIWLVFCIPVYAQSVYPISGEVRDHQGNVVPAATVIILSGNLTTVNTATQPGSPLATIYSDPAGTMVINQVSNPVTTSGTGQFVAYGAPGSYVIQAYRNGYQLIAPFYITTNGTGCTVSGSTGTIVFNNGSGACTQDNRLTFTTGTGNETVPSIENFQYVDCANSAARTGADIGAWFNAAEAALPANGGSIYFAAGSCTATTEMVVNKILQIGGSGPSSTNITWGGSASVAPIEVNTLFAAPYLNGRISGFTLTCTSNGPGIHQIDTIGEIYDDLAIVGCGPKGLWFDNVAGFNERTNLGTLSMYHSGIYLTNNNTTTPFPNSNSFGFGWWHGVHFQVAASQSAVTAVGCVSCGSGTNATTSGGLGVAGPFAGVSSVFIYNSGDFAISANLEAASSTLVTLSSGSALAGIRLDIDAECTGCSGATSFNIDATSVLNADISSHIAVQGLVPVTAMGAVYLPQGQITGTGVPVFSDAPFIAGPTFYCDMVPNCPSFLQLGTATSGGNFSSTKAYFNASIWNGSAPVLDQFSLFNSCASTGTNPVCTFTIGHAGSTGNNYVSIPQSLTFGSVTVDPVSPPNGSEWYRSDLGYLKCQQAGVAAQCGAAPGSGAFSGGLGASYQDVTEIAAPANPAAGNDRLYLNSSTHLLACVTSGGANCMPSAGGGSAALSALTVATATNSINNGSYQQSWNWQKTGSGNEYGFLISENAASTNSGTTYLFGIHTLSSSTISPFEFDANGIGWYLTTSGLLKPLSSGTIALGGTAHGFVIDENGSVHVSLVCALNTVALGQGSSTDPLCGTVPNAALTNSTMTINSTTCTLGGSCTPPGSLWNGIGNPAGNLSLTMGTNLSTFNYTSALNNAFSWQNNTAATSSVSQSSPVLNLCGQGWEGGSPANTQDCWQFQNSIANGANSNVTGIFSFTGSSTGHYAIQVPNLINLGIASDNLPYGGGTAVQGSVTAPSANGQYVCGYAVTAAVKVPPTCPILGLGTDSITGAGSTYTVTYAQNATVTTHDVAGSSAVNVTLPTATTLGNAAFVWKYCNHSTQTDTITPTTWTIQAGSAAGAATLSVSSGVCYSISVDANSSTQWHADGTNTGGGGGGGTVTGYSCTMSSATTCTATVASVTSPICVSSLQSTSTVIASNCNITSTTATVTAGSSNSGTWGIALLTAPGSGSSFVRINTYTSSCAAATTPCNVSVTVPMGDLAVVDVYAENSGAISLTTDSNSSTYSNAFNDTAALQSGNGSIREDFVCQASGAITTIHGNVPSGAGGSAVVVRVYSGASASCGDQVSSPATNTGATQTAGSITTGGSRLITGVFFQNTSDTNAFTGSGIYGNSVNQGNAPSNTTLGGVDALNEPASVYAATTTTTGSVGWYARTVSYK